MVVVVSYKGWKVVGFWWRQIKWPRTFACVTKQNECTTKHEWSSVNSYVRVTVVLFSTTLYYLLSYGVLYTPYS